MTLMRVKITLGRVKITLMRVEITLERVKITFFVNKYLKIDKHACEFHTQTCHFQTFAFRVF
jgi:hypothetical protein